MNLEEEYLSVLEAAALMGMTDRGVRKKIGTGACPAVTIGGGRGGDGGVSYLIPLSALSPKLQDKYRRHKIRENQRARRLLADEIKADGGAADDTRPHMITPAAFTDADRARIGRWLDIFAERDKHRARAVWGTMDAADAAFIESWNAAHPHEKPLKIRTVYQHWKSYADSGMNEAALLDRRGHGNGGGNVKIAGIVKQEFEALYLDGSRPSVNHCLTIMRREWKEMGWDAEGLPGARALERYAATKIPEPVLCFMRFGEKAYLDQCAPYISRLYRDVAANQIWCADNHTFDVITISPDGRLYRPHLTMFLDVRTRKAMGWCLTEHPDSDATVYALKKGVEHHGIPEGILSDNGREFLTHDIGGNGFRHKKGRKKGYDPSVLDDKQLTILKGLGIGFTTALPRNARAKLVERAFRTYKEQLSRMFATYTGGTVLEKPDSLKDALNRPEMIITARDFARYVDAYITGVYNKTPHRGDGMYNHSPDEVFAALLVEKRVAPPDKLDLMFMRWSKPLKVRENGIELTLYGKKLQYYDQEIWLRHQKREVFVRYAPDDLNAVRVYDAEGLFLGVARLKEQLGYAANKEQIAAAQKKIAEARRAADNYVQASLFTPDEQLELMVKEAAEAAAKGGGARPEVIHVVRDLYDAPAIADDADDETDAAPPDNVIPFNWQQRLGRTASPA